MDLASRRRRGEPLARRRRVVILRAAKESIFSGLNNLEVCSLIVIEFKKALRGETLEAAAEDSTNRSEALCSRVSGSGDPVHDSAWHRFPRQRSVDQGGRTGLNRMDRYVLRFFS